MKWPWSALVAFVASYLRWICLRLALLGARYVSLSRAILLLLGAEIEESIQKFKNLSKKVSGSSGLTSSARLG